MDEKSIDHLRIRLGRASDSGNLESVVSIAREILAQDPEDFHAHHNCATALLELNRPGEAFPHVEALLSLAPDRSASHCVLAEFYLKKKKLKKGIRAIDDALAIDPDNVHCLSVAAILHVRRFQTKKALVFLERAKALDPNDPWVTSTMVALKGTKMFVTTGAYRRQIEELEEALALNPDDPTLHASIGRIYLEDLDDPRSAEAHFREALRAEPGNRLVQKELFQAVASRNIAYGVLNLPAKIGAHLKTLATLAARKPLVFLWYFFILSVFAFSFALFGWILLVVIIFYPPAKVYEWLLVPLPQKGAATKNAILRLWWRCQDWPRWIRRLLTLSSTIGYWMWLGWSVGISIETSAIFFGIFYAVHYLLIAIIILPKRWRARRSRLS